MAILVDTNVILDVVYDDPQWFDWSDGCLMTHRAEGLIVNPMIYAELCTKAAAAAEVDAILDSLNLVYEEIGRQALYLAARAFGKYRKRSGAKSAPLPDFFIGAHAEALDIPLLTRDKGRYATYFPRVRLICP